MKKLILALILLSLIFVTKAQRIGSLEVINEIEICYRDTLRFIYIEGTVDDIVPVTKLFIEKGIGLSEDYKAGKITKEYLVIESEGNYSLFIKENDKRVFILTNNKVGNPQSNTFKLPSSDPLAKKMQKMGSLKARKLMLRYRKLAEDQIKKSINLNLKKFKLLLERKANQSSFPSGDSYVLTSESGSKISKLKAWFHLRDTGALSLVFRNSDNPRIVEYSKINYSAKQSFGEISMICEIRNHSFGIIGRTISKKFTLGTINWKKKIKKSIRRLELNKINKILK